MGGFLAVAVPIIVTIIKAFDRLEPNRPTPTVQHLTVDERVGLIAKAKTRLGMDLTKFNFGLTGQTRTGKSSLVNALRGIDDGAPGAAKVGEVETTMEVTRFIHPNNPFFHIWDIPGVGTATHPVATYFDDKCLLGFDCLLVVYDQAVTENDLYIAREAVNAGIPVLVVRNKANVALEARRRRDRNLPEATVRAQLIDEIKSNMRSNLATKGLQDLPIFVVSAWDFMQNQFEEQALLQALLEISRRRV